MWRNDQGECDLPVPAAGVGYAAHLQPTLLLQALLEGDTVRFLSRRGPLSSPGGPHGARGRYPAALLVADHRAGLLGDGAARVDAVLPGGLLLSRAAAAGQTVTGACAPGPPSRAEPS
ncbi:unnamed protein product [Prorocentrum cordatum]|uniref:Anaphase-promoting complex subunit 1 n=1 Tax=Prorocentrum cordatum TaxID=2364126 RepID=A0ABN9RC04_9DINO|nr:unnamed protein product [Polarella glacialis]